MAENWLELSGYKSVWRNAGNVIFCNSNKNRARLLLQILTDINTYIVASQLKYEDLQKTNS